MIGGTGTAEEPTIDCPFELPENVPIWPVQGYGEESVTSNKDGVSVVANPWFGGTTPLPISNIRENKIPLINTINEWNLANEYYSAVINPGYNFLILDMQEGYREERRVTLNPVKNGVRIITSSPGWKFPEPGNIWCRFQMERDFINRGHFSRNTM